MWCGHACVWGRCVVQALCGCGYVCGAGVWGGRCGEACMCVVWIGVWCGCVSVWVDRCVVQVCMYVG